MIDATRFRELWVIAEAAFDFGEEPDRDRTQRALSDFLLSHASELLALVEASGWRGIESAPRDGTRVLVWSVPIASYYNADEPPHVAIAYWLERRPNEIRMGFHSGWVWHGMAGCTFTHWMPLPPAPEPAP